jgi:FAD/FMN-containing dehydrogenase
VELWRPGTAAFETARQVFNQARQGTPWAIARCASAADVQTALQQAEGHPIAVRAGGHSVHGFGSTDDALVLDLRPLAGLDLRGDVLSVGGGATWGDVFALIEPRGMVTPSGFDPRVGVAGLTLGGGYGVLSRTHGLACDNLVGAEVVLPSGERVEADAELLWALRGAGAAFGVVTRLDLQLHPAPPLVAGQIVYPLARVREILRALRDLLAGFPDEVSVFVGLDTRDEGKMFVRAFHVGDHAGARRWLAPLPYLGGALESAFHEARYAPVANRDVFPEGHAHRWGADFLAAFDDVALEAVAEHALRLRGRRLWMVVEHLGGAISRVAPDATAFPHRAARHGVVSCVRWQGAAPDDVLAEQASLQRALAPVSIGRYVNYAAAEDSHAAYGANLARLQALKARLDPDDRLRAHVRFRGSSPPAA